MPRRSDYLALVVWIWASWPVAAFAASAYGRVENWRAEPGGLPQNNLQSVYQSRDGFLWLTSWDGLVRFDGSRFQLHNRFGTDEMRGDACGPLAEAGSGSMWVGTRAGLAHREGATFRPFTRADGLPFAVGTQLVFDPSVGLWAGGHGGVAHWRDGKFRAFTVADGLLDTKVLSLLVTAPGELVVVTERGIVRFDAARDRFESPPHEVTPGNRPVHVIRSRARPGEFLAASEVGLWRRVGHGAWIPLPGAGEATSAAVRFLFEDSEGNIWLQRRDGPLRRWTQGALHDVSLGSHPTPPVINAITEDTEGNLWLTSQAHGLFRLTPQRVRSHTVEDGLPMDHVGGVSVARDGSVWAATERGAGQWQQGRWHVWRNLEMAGAPNEVRMRNNFTAVAARRDGSVWLGTWGRACYRTVPGAAQLKRVGMTGTGIVDHAGLLYEDRDGALWIGCGGRGVARVRSGAEFREDELLHLAPQAPLSNGDVLCMVQTRDGAHWFGTKRGGLNRWQQGTNTVFSRAEGLPSDTITALHEDADGVLWIGTAGGLARHERGRFRTFTTREGMLDDLVNGLVEDDFGCFWISCNRGIARIQRADLNAVAAGRLVRAPHVVVGEQDGMASAETNGGSQSSSAKSPDGRLWFPTIRGVVEIDPARWRDNTNAPAVHIEEAIASGRTVPHADALALPPGSGHALEFHFTATSLTDPARIRFRCRLEGHDANWRELGARRTASYTNLKPGPYRFQVTACNHHGYWHPTGAALALAIAPHYYETRWFLGLVVGLVLGTVAGAHAYRLRVARRFAEQQRQHALELERARIARDLHDNLGAGLSQVALLGELASHSEQNALGQEPLARLAEQARAAQRSLNEVVWAASAKHDTLAGLLNYLADFAPPFCEAAGLRCRLEFPLPVPERALDGPVRQHLFLIAKEAIHNAARHAKARTVTLAASLHGDELELSVTDDGAGFDPAEATARERASGGNGLPNLHARAAEAGARLTLRSAVGQGTTVTIRLRLRPA